MKGLLREPLLHFLVLGAALFGLYGLIGKKEAEAPAKVVISSERVANVADRFARTWRRAPTQQELQGLVEEEIRDEVFYREGRAAGLDRDDFLIRRRVRQKMEFLAEDMAAADATEEQLAAYLASNSERFRTDDRLTFHHIFLSGSRRGSALEGDARKMPRPLSARTAPRRRPSSEIPFCLAKRFAKYRNATSPARSAKALPRSSRPLRQAAGRGRFHRASECTSS